MTLPHHLKVRFMKMKATDKKNILTRYDISTALLCLLGMIPGLVCWNRLPDVIPMHWGIDNQPDGWGSKAFVVFGLPLIMVALHLICCLADNLNTKAGTQPRAVRWITRIIMPILCLVLECVTVLYVLDLFHNIGLVCCLLLGIMMIVIGNYLPKTRPNLTFGIKLPWTIHDEEVWNKTHRLAGWFMVAGGIIVLAATFLGAYVVSIVTIFIAVFLPILYSFVISRKK